jgi:N-acetylglucosamine malate deacetylase 2
MKILTIFAHPDDETMLTGGTLALLNWAGADMYYLCATRGEGGELGEPPVCTRDEIGIFRARELARAVEALGGGQLYFLDHIDPLVGENEELYPYTADFAGLTTQIIDHIQKIQPTAIITHGINGEYGHPGHIMTHQAVQAAVTHLGAAAPLFYIFCADFPDHPRPRHANQDNPAHFIVDVATMMDQKIRAAYAHRSQHALFARRSSQRAGYRLTIPEIIYNVESLHRVFPNINGQADDEIIRLLKPWEKKNV